MQKNQFTDEQIVAILQQAEKGEQIIAEVCRQHNVSENSFYRWRSRFGGATTNFGGATTNFGGATTNFGGATTNEAARLRELEKQNAPRKRLLAEKQPRLPIP